jgi:tetratricopeptide (TPR) repeat protein
VEGQQGERAGPYFSRASKGEEPVLSARLATYLLRPAPKLALELADGGVPVSQWGWAALSFVERKPELADRIREDARAALPQASPAEAADLYYLLARVADAAEAPDLFRAAATTLSAGLTGDLDRDRGHLGFLSRLWEEAGAVEQAVLVLEPALKRWPEDMTFHEDRAELALRTGDPGTAVAEGALAVQYGHGDNRLRALKTYAEALHQVGRTEEAVALVRQTLAETLPPAEGVQVRTPRYLDALRSLPFLTVESEDRP